MTARIFFKKVWLVLLKSLLRILYTIVLLATCAGISVIFSSPVVLGYITIMDCLNKPITLLGGKILYLWLFAVAVVFVPLLVYSIVYRIKQLVKTKEALQKAKAQAKAGEDK